MDEREYACNFDAAINQARRRGSCFPSGILANPFRRGEEIRELACINSHLPFHAGFEQLLANGVEESILAAECAQQTMLD